MKLRDELQAQGFDVRPEFDLDAAFGDAHVRAELEPAVLSVFLLGDKYDEFITRQISLAGELQSRVVFWLDPTTARTADERQRRLVDEIRSGHGLPRGFTLLERMTSRDMIREVMESLRPAPAAAPDPAGQAQPAFICSMTRRHRRTRSSRRSFRESSVPSRWKCSPHARISSPRTGWRAIAACCETATVSCCTVA